MLNINNKYMAQILIILLFFVLVFEVNAADRIQVAVAIKPLETFVKVVGGNKIKVSTMIPPGYSPANYAPGPKQMMQLSEAEIYFSLHMPAEKENIIPDINSFNKQIRIIFLDQIVAKKYKYRKFDQGVKDPHIWMSPQRVKIMIRSISQQLIKLDKENKKYYQKNAKIYLEKLNRVDKKIKNKLEKMQQRTFLINHPVLGYFAKDYNLKMIAIEKNGKKATPQRLTKLISLAREKKINVIMYQKVVSSRQAEIIAQEINGKAIEINPLASDYIMVLNKITGIFSKYFK